MHLLFLITIKKEQLAANVEKLHTSFVLWCLIYAIEKVYLGEESLSLIGFLEWVAST